MAGNIQAVQTGAGWDVDGPRKTPVFVNLDESGRPAGDPITSDDQVVADVNDGPSRAYKVFLPCDNGSGLALSRLGGPNHMFAGAGNSTMWANPGAVTSTAASAGTDGALHLNKHAVDWFQDAVTPRWGILAFEIKGAAPGAATRIIGNSSGSNAGWGIAANTNGTLAMRYSSGDGNNKTGGDNVIVALDGTNWHKVFVVLDSVNRAMWMWCDRGRHSQLSLVDVSTATRSTQDFTFGNTGSGAATLSLQFRNIHYLSGTGKLPSNMTLARNAFMSNPGAPLNASVIDAESFAAAKAAQLAPTVISSPTAHTLALWRYLRSTVGRAQYLVGQSDQFDGALYSPNNYDSVGQFASICGGNKPGLAEFEYIDITQPADASDPLGDIPGSQKQARLIAAMRAHYLAGGVVAMCDHPGNPTTGNMNLYPAASVSHPDFGKGSWTTTGGVTPIKSGGAQYAQFTGYLDRLAEFFAKLDFPVIWRPFHEANGDWFWWARPIADYVTVWREMVTYLKAKGVNNVLFSWNLGITHLGGNVDDNATNAYSQWYPGDDYVDIITADWYFNDPWTATTAYTPLRVTLLNNWDALRAIAAPGGKPLGFGEFGYRGSYPASVYDPNVWTVVDGAISGEYIDCCLLSFWFPGDGGPTPNTLAAPSLLQAYNLGHMVTADRTAGAGVYL